jgi:peptidoglycan/xylan/chitin deacetylase (PgdA/CDA1 family)
MSDRLALCYHALSESWPAVLAVKPTRFERQLSWLTERGYRGVTFSDLVMDRGEGKRVAVTFDDGYSSVLSKAVPVLARLGWPATIFVPAALIGAGSPLAWLGTRQWLRTRHRGELEPLSWDELAALAAAGWEVGSHSLTHPYLTAIDAGALDYELALARLECEYRLRRACTTVAYPYGDVDDNVVLAARRAGYLTGAALAARGRPAHSLEWPRVGVYRGDDLRRFRMKVSRSGRLVQGTTAGAVARAFARVSG